MRILATWIAVFFSVFHSALGNLRPFVLGSGYNNPHSWQWVHFIQAVDLAMFGCVIWGAIYLLHIKDKAAHEKIGLGVNIYWFAIMAFGYACGLFMGMPGR